MFSFGTKIMVTMLNVCDLIAIIHLSWVCQTAEVNKYYRDQIIYQLIDDTDKFSLFICIMLFSNADSFIILN